MYRSRKVSIYLDEITDNIHDSKDETKIGSLISQKKFMKSATSRTVYQHTVDISTKNVLRRRIFRANPEVAIENVEPMGKECL